MINSTDSEISKNIDTIKNVAKELMQNAGGCHDWYHTKRVYNICQHIGNLENADMEILSLAAVLHDIGREEEDKANGSICHAERGSVIASEILSRHGYDKDKINKICHCIETHRYRNSKEPESIEARVLFDADKLDSIGAVGIGRAFLFAGEVGATLHIKDIDLETTRPYSKEDTGFREFKAKLQYVKDRMLTTEGKRLAEGRHEYMVEFFKRLDDEVEGNK